ncbi:MAG TPA: HAMP domain-containing sensor histidine kinase [Candidatus Dormibacteraeota bacterium]
MATAVVAVLYTLVAAVTYSILSARLTSSVDSRLANTLRLIARRYDYDHVVVLFGPASFPQAPRAERLAPPVLVWAVEPGGTVNASATGLDLPAPDRAVGAPTTVTLGSEQLRIAGQPVGPVHVVVGSTLTPVTQAQTTLLVTEALIAPVLLLGIFAGAYAVGRRAAAPIEIARRRQQELTADASHELRTPLAVIEAEASLALTGRRNAQWYRDAFGRVEVEAQRMRTLVEDMLWLARVEVDDPSRAAREPVDLGVLAQQAADRFQTVAEVKQQSLSVSAEIPVAVGAPAEWIDRLLGVLVDNACRYTPAGGHIAVRVDEAGGRARVAVDDSGPGIAEAERQRVFDRFHRATDAAGGAGLGLAIADAVVRATGGRWELSTSALGGAGMAVTWPKA